MKVKVQCPCGSRFEFEVEPLNGRMPVSIACPTCGADATELANGVIAQQLATATPAAPSVPIAAAIAPAPPVPPTAASGLRISKAAAAPEAAPVVEAAAESFEPCYRHKKEPAVDHCVVCGKPICEICRVQFGHVCSVFCREAAPHHGIKVPVYARQRGQAEARAERKVKYALMAAGALVALLAGAWMFYSVWLRQPHVVYSFLYPKSRGSYDSTYELVAPNQLLSLRNDQLTLLDVTKNAPIWTLKLPDNSRPTVDFFEDESAHLEPKISVTPTDIWVTRLDQVVRVDRATGQRKDLALPEFVRGVVVGSDAILLRSDVEQQVTRISLADGSTNIEPMSRAAMATRAPTAKRPVQSTGARGLNNGPSSAPAQLRGLATRATVSPTEEDPAPQPTRVANEPPDASGTWLVDAGENAVQFSASLVQRLTVTHEALKKRGKSVLDSQNVTASQGIDLAEEMMNDQKRDETGGVDIEDVSLYGVTVHRLFAKGAPDLLLTVTGPPRFIALKKVDLLVAGTNLIVLDKNNKELWRSTLAFLTRERQPYEAENKLPCLETKDALYFADKGVLTRFDLNTGNVRWRLPTVGVSEITAGDHGELYVATSTATAESIRYSQQVDLKHRVDLVIMRVDPELGKVMWNKSFESTSYRVLPAGKFLYSVHEWQEQDPLRMEDGPDNKFNIKLIKPSSGDELWKYTANGKSVLKVEAQQNWILVQFTDEVRVLKFFSF